VPLWTRRALIGASRFSNARTSADSIAVTPLFKAFAALSALFVLVAAIGLVLATSWYVDDACETAQWKCDAGGLGLGLVYVCILPAVFLGCTTLLMLIAGRHRRDPALPPK
jgi:hypothetical protein